jgi:hypothetical protein
LLENQQTADPCGQPPHHTDSLQPAGAHMPASGRSHNPVKSSKESKSMFEFNTKNIYELLSIPSKVFSGDLRQVSSVTMPASLPLQLTQISPKILLE